MYIRDFLVYQTVNGSCGQLLLGADGDRALKGVQQRDAELGGQVATLSKITSKVDQEILDLCAADGRQEIAVNVLEPHDFLDRQAPQLTSVVQISPRNQNKRRPFAVLERQEPLEAPFVGEQFEFDDGASRPSGDPLEFEPIVANAKIQAGRQEGVEMISTRRVEAVECVDLLQH